MSVALISHMMSIIFIDAKCENKTNMRKQNCVANFFYSVYYMSSLKFILVLFSICILHVINNLGIPLQNLICRLLMLCCGENILWRFTLVVYCINFLKQVMLTITQSFVRNIFILVGFSIFIFYVILIDLWWKNILRLIDLIDWLIDWLCITPILSNISAKNLAGVPGDNHRPWAINC